MRPQKNGERVSVIKRLSNISGKVLDTRPQLGQKKKESIRFSYTILSPGRFKS